MLQNKPQLVEPIDFENFIQKNKTVLQNDPQRELLLYPPDDISVRIIAYVRYVLYLLYALITFSIHSKWFYRADIDRPFKQFRTKQRLKTVINLQSSALALTHLIGISSIINTVVIQDNFKIYQSSYYFLKTYFGTIDQIILFIDYLIIS